jgi:hypothetical protein
MLIPLSISIASIRTHVQTNVEYPNQKVFVNKGNCDVILYNDNDCFSRLSYTKQSHDREYIDRLQMNEIPYLQITIPD